MNHLSRLTNNKRLLFGRLFLLFSLLLCGYISTMEPYPKPQCDIEPPRQQTAVSPTHINFSVAITARSRFDHMSVYHNDQLVYACSHVIRDPLAGAGDSLNLIIARSGDTIRFETKWDGRVWEEVIIANEKMVFGTWGDDTFESYLVSANYDRINGWYVKQHSEPIIYE